MSEEERLEIDSTFAFHSAPTLLGVKCANLISFNMNERTMSEYLREFADKLSGSGLCANSSANAESVHLSISTMRKCLTHG